MEIENGILKSYVKSDLVNGSIVIPEGVKKISSSAFASLKSNINQHITSIQFPESLEEIEDSAFEFFVEIENVKLPKNLKTIGENAFRYCGKLKLVEIPEGLETIGNNAFRDCALLKSITLPNKLKTIGEGAFYNCKSLESIKIPETIETINPFTFEYCTKLKKVDLPNNLKSIENYAFANCYKLSNIKLPENLESLGKGCFSNCAIKSIKIPSLVKTLSEECFYACINLRNIELPENLESINNSAFNTCIALKKINIPDNVSRIGVNAFYHCNKLKNIILPKNLTEISENTFSNCRNLNSVVISDNTKIIGNSAFFNCAKLKNVTILGDVEKLGGLCFYDCNSLNNISLPDSITEIGENAFHSTGITEIELPKNLRTLEPSAFSNCDLLSKVTFRGDNLTELGYGCFNLCKSLKEITLPENLKVIGNSCFEYCSNLKNVNLPSTLEDIRGYAFSCCEKLSNLELPNSIKTIASYAFNWSNNLTSIFIPDSIKSIPKELNVDSTNKEMFTHYVQGNGGFYLTSSPSENSLPLQSIKINLGLFSKCYSNNKDTYNEQKSEQIASFYNILLSELPDEKIEEFTKNHTFKFYKQLHKRLDTFLTDESKNIFYTALYDLGVFEPPANYNGKIIDYSQKVTNFLLQEIEEKELSNNQVLNIFFGMKPYGFKKEFTDFYLENFTKITHDYRYYVPQFTAKAYNNFEAVQATNTNNHGGQRQLKPTIQKFLDYFKEIKFDGITPETKPIADEVGAYFKDQDAFDYAVEIMNEKKKNNVPDHILGKPLKESDVFKTIDDYEEKIKTLQLNTLEEMTNIADNEFTFEWLSKNDPKNLILGKLCSCCAHLQGAGYGIMHASIVHPHVQNLVIKDKNGKIVAKSTLYINEKEGYGVFNNVEVNNLINDDSNPNLRNQIYQKFMLGLNEFAENYNKQHKDNPLKQINVGMHLNDIGTEIAFYNGTTNNKLVPLNYATFGRGVLSYPGDSYEMQSTVWKNKDLPLEEQENKENQIEKELS